MCGEHDGFVHAGGAKQGSSPHVRGTPPSPFSRPMCRRIIPACAGNTFGSIVGMTPSGDHPRMCGEHQSRVALCRRIEGSSPHVRGTLAGRAAEFRVDGIIPACAGNTCGTIRVGESSGDHPRMCGEHRLNTIAASSMTGSSPHVRGTHGRSPCSAPDIGIIPACAGNTAKPRRRTASARDHPRMCGEH